MALDSRIGQTVSNLSMREMRNLIGLSLGYAPLLPEGVSLTGKDGQLDHSRELFNDPQEVANINQVINWVQAAGHGGTYSVKINPQMYAAKTGGVTRFPLITVTDSQGQETVIDGGIAEGVVAQNGGKPLAADKGTQEPYKYDSKQDFFDKNLRDPGGVLVTRDSSGKLTEKAAANVTSWEYVEPYVSGTVGAVGVVGGILLTPETLGTSNALTATGWVMIATAIGYGGVTSARELMAMNNQGQTLNPFESQQARGAWIGVVSVPLTVAVGSLKVAAPHLAKLNSGASNLSRLQQIAGNEANWSRLAEGMGGIDAFANNGVMTEGLLDAYQNRENMTWEDWGRLAVDVGSGGASWGVSRFTGRRSVTAEVDQARPISEVFYSAAISAIEQNGQPKATPQQWIKLLEKSGAKKDELEWVGIIEWLNGKKAEAGEGTTIPREAVLEFMQENRIVLRDRILRLQQGKPQKGLVEVPASLSKEEERDYVAVHRFKAGENTFYRVLRDRNNRYQVFQETANGTLQHIELIANPTNLAFLEQLIQGHARRNSNTARFAYYQIPGGKSYTELLIELPVLDQIPWRSHHFKSKEIAHVRFDTRNVDGKKTLFINEIQSDLHQKGRKRGYAERIDNSPERIAEVSNLIKRHETLGTELDDIKRVLAETWQNIIWPALAGAVAPTYPKIHDEYQRAGGATFGAGNVMNFTLDVERFMGASQSERDRLISKGLITRDQGHRLEGLIATSSPEIVEFIENVKKNHEIIVERAGIEEKLYENTPDAPFKGERWLELSLKRMVAYAVDNGYDAISWARSDQIAEAVRTSPSYLSLQYDQKIVRFLEKYTAAYGGEIGEANVVEGDASTNSILYFTPKMRENNTHAYRLDDNGHPEAMYDPATRKITISRDAENPTKALRHEIIHALNDRALISDPDWQILSNAAIQEGWMETYDIRSRYEERYLKEFGEEGLERRLVEEAVSEAYADWERNPTFLPPRLQALFERIRDFLLRQIAKLAGVNLRTSDDVFGRIERGDIAGKNDGAGQSIDGNLPPSAQALADRVLKDAVEVRQGEVSEAKPGVLYSQGGSDGISPGQIRPISEVFYSAAIHAIETSERKSAQPEYWRKRLESSGANKDELDWIGVLRWLRIKKGEIGENGLISREDLLEYMTINSLDLSESVLIDASKIKPEFNVQPTIVTEAEKQEGGLQAYRVQIDNLAFYRVVLNDDNKYSIFKEGTKNNGSPMLDPVAGNETIKSMPDVLSYIQADAYARKIQVAYPKEVMPGGRDYTELLITMPELAASNYRSKHFGNQEVVHIRFDTREVNGKKVLFIGEIQSDLHQAGRKFGYPDKDKTYLKKRLNVLNREIGEHADKVYAQGRLISALEGQVYEIIREAYAQAGWGNEQDNGVRWLPDWAKNYLSRGKIPEGRLAREDIKVLDAVLRTSEKVQEFKKALQQLHQLHVQADKLAKEFDTLSKRKPLADAPFKGDLWVKLALKRMLAYAVDNNFDGISWGRPDQVAKINDLKPEKVEILYGITVKRFFEKYAQSYDGQIENENVIDGDGQNSVLYLTPQMRENNTHMYRVGRDGKPEAAYDPVNKLITLSPHALDPTQALRHEAIHVLKDLGLFNDYEWQTLSDAAKQEGWMNLGNIRERYEEKYRKQFGEEGLEERLVEEAVAEAYMHWQREPTYLPTPVLELFEKIRDFFVKLASYLGGENLQTFEDVFRRVERGDVAGRRASTAAAQDAGLGTDIAELAARILPGNIQVKSGKIDGDAHNSLSLTARASRQTLPPYNLPYRHISEIYKSPALRYLENEAPEAAFPDKWKKLLLGPGGANKDELEWVGTLAWLDQQKATKGAKTEISREELMSQMSENRIILDEAIRQENVASEFKVKDITGNIKLTAEEQKYYTSVHRFEIGGEAFYRVYQTADQQYHVFWEKKQLPIGEPEREHLGSRNKVSSLEKAREIAVEHYRRKKGVVRYKDETVAGGQDYSELQITLPYYRDIYFSRHYGTHDLAVARFDTRYVDGHKILFVHEVQSDVHQRGRHKGYIPRDEAKFADTQGARDRHYLLKAERTDFALAHNTEIDQILKTIVAEALKQNPESSLSLGIFSLEQMVGLSRRYLAGDTYAVSKLNSADIEILENVLQTNEKVRRVSESLGHKKVLDSEIESSNDQLPRMKEYNHLSKDMERPAPDAPFKDDRWIPLVLDRLRAYALDNGFEGISWISGEQVRSIYRFEPTTDENRSIIANFNRVYDQKVPAYFADYASRLDGEIEQVNIVEGDDNTNPILYFTPEMRVDDKLSQ